MEKCSCKFKTLFCKNDYAIFISKDFSTYFYFTMNLSWINHVAVTFSITIFVDRSPSIHRYP